METDGRGRRAERYTMQIESDQTVCPACGAEGLEIFPVLHHMMCAYVARQSDFAPAGVDIICPKRRRNIASGAPTCEIVGTGARCFRCRREIGVPPPAVSP